MCRDVPKSQTFAGKQVVNSVKQESDRMTAADNRKKVLQIKAPRTVNTENGVSLCADIVIGGRTETVWFEVNCKYAPFLTDDRLDAFVAACLYRAMMMGADIECEAPVSRRLLYQLNNYLLPVLADNIPEFHSIHVIADPADLVFSERNAVATGWTGGVDSMYTFMQMSGDGASDIKLTHLLIANNGALESDDNEELLRNMVANTENGIAREAGLSVIGVNSNLDRVFSDETYLAVAGFRLPAAVLALQKMFSVFFNSAGYEFSRFSFVPNNSAYYEMFIMPNLSTENTVFYSSGGAASRIRKLKELSEYPPAHRYLHPCIYTSETNCGMCGKCVRTEAALYALGTLDRFGEVFDLNAFEKNKDRILAEIISKRKSQHYGEAYTLLRKEGLLTGRAEQIAASMNAAKTVVSRNRERIEELLSSVRESDSLTR